MDAVEFVNVGIYSIPQASRLTGIPMARVRRWIKGYHYQQAGKRRHSDPDVTRELPPIDGTEALGFLDLIDLRFVDAFLRFGVSMKTIRHAAERASILFTDRHPFASRRFYTDGRRVLAEIQSGAPDDKALLDLKADQLGFYEVIKPSLRAGLIFDELTGQAVEWAPNPETPHVVLDPKRQFGQPIIKSAGIQTSVLAAAYKAERSVARVAAWFEITEDEVGEALRFELKAA